MRRQFGGELARDGRERLVDRHVGLDDERRSVALGEQRERRARSGPPAWIAIQAEGRSSNSRSVDAASGAFAAHSTAIRASCAPETGGPPTPPSSAARAAPPAGRDGRRHRRRGTASSCAVAATRRPRARSHADRGASTLRPSAGAPATGVATSGRAAASKPLSRRRPPVGGPSDAARVRVVSTRGIQPARRREGARAPARAADEGTRTTASRHVDDACRAQSAHSAAIASQRSATPPAARRALARAGGTRAIVVIGSRWGGRQCVARAVCQNDCALPDALLLSALPAHLSATGTRIPP